MDIEYRAIRIAPHEVEHAVVNVLRLMEARGAIIFCQTREAVRHLHASLVERGFAAVALSGEFTQGERTHALQALRDGRARVCVATDVAARGIDLPGLELVIHAELPNDRDTLLHRSGRTGRAGRKGICVLLVPYTRRRKAEGLIAQARVDVVWSGPPTAEQIRLADQTRMQNDPIFTDANTEEDSSLARMLMEQRTPEEIASALVRLYRSRLPAAEELYDAASAPERGPRPTRDRPDKRERVARKKTGEADASAPPNVDPTYAPRSSEPMIWFRMNVGRSNNADPKWILPVICRLGHVTKKEIGVIKIFDKETKFEIAESVAPRFASAVRRSSDENVHIQPAAGSMQEMRKKPARDDASPAARAKEPFKPRPQKDGKRPHGEGKRPYTEGKRPQAEGKRTRDFGNRT